jgi:hypothetical protein
MDNDDSEATDDEQDPESSEDNNQFTGLDDDDLDDKTTNKSDTEVVIPPDSKVARELSKLSAYYNTGNTLSRTRSGKNYEDDDDIEDSNEESGSDTDGMQDVTALVMDQLMEPKLDSSFLEKVEFGLSTVDLEKYRWMDPDKVPPSVYRDLFTVPEKFKDVWSHPNEWQQKKWRKSIIKELTKMENHKVWKVIKRNEVPKGRWCVKHKWVFEIKRNGVFRARLVACGYCTMHEDEGRKDVIDVL